MPVDPSIIYKAFISYSHSDEIVAKKLHSALHRFAKPFYRLRQMRVFRDKTNLAASPELWTAIEQSLSQAEYFILIASPEAAKSKWVRKEIDWWLSNRSYERFLIVLAKGEISWDESIHDFTHNVSLNPSNALPTDVNGRFKSEPLYVDLSWATSPKELTLSHVRFREAVLSLSATLLSQPKDKLDGDDVREHQRTKLAVSVAIGAITLFAGIATWEWRLADERGRVALSRQLAAQAQNLLDERLEVGLLLAVAGIDASPTIEARSTLLSAILHNPHLLRHIDLGKPGAPMSVAYGPPDGSILASGNWDGSVRLWDTRSGRALEKSVLKHGAQVAGIAFSSDGNYLAAGGNDGAIRVWNVAKRQLFREVLQADNTRVNAVAFTGELNGLLSAGESGAVYWWDLSSERSIQFDYSYVGQTSPAYSVAFDQRNFVVGVGGLHGVSLYARATDRSRIVTGPVEETRGMLASGLAFSPDGELLAVSDDRGNETLIFPISSDLRAGNLLRLQTGPTYSIAFSPDGRLLLTGGYDGNLRLWNVLDGNLVGDPIKGHDGPIKSVAFSPMGEMYASGGPDGLIRIWSINPRIVLAEKFDAHDNPKEAVSAISSNGTVLASMHEDGGIRLWNISSRKSMGKPLEGHADAVTALAVSADTSVASGAADGSIFLWRIMGDAWSRTKLNGHKAPIKTLAFSPRGGVLVSAGEDKSIYIWDPDTGIARSGPLLGHENYVSSLAINADATILASADMSGVIILWRLPSGERLTDTALRPGLGLIKNIAFSPDNKTLAIAGDRYPQGAEREEGVVLLLDVETHKLQSDPITGFKGSVNSVTFSEDGSMLLAGGGYGIIRLWDVDSHRPIGIPIQANKNYVLSLTISADGKNMVSVGDDKRMTSWKLDIESWKNAACSRVNRNLTHREWNFYIGENWKYLAPCPHLPIPSDD